MWIGEQPSPTGEIATHGSKNDLHDHQVFQVRQRIVQSCKLVRIVRRLVRESTWYLTGTLLYETILQRGVTRWQQRFFSTPLPGVSGFF